VVVSSLLLSQQDLLPLHSNCFNEEYEDDVIIKYGFRVLLGACCSVLRSRRGELRRTRLVDGDAWRVVVE